MSQQGKTVELSYRLPHPVIDAYLVVNRQKVVVQPQIVFQSISYILFLLRIAVELQSEEGLPNPDDIVEYDAVVPTICSLPAKGLPTFKGVYQVQRLL